MSARVHPADLCMSDPLRDTYVKGMFATRYAELAPSADAYTLAFAFDSISLLVSFLKLFKCGDGPPHVTSM